MNMMGVACGGFGVGRRRVEASRATRVQAIMFICVHPCEKHFGRRGRSGGRDERWGMRAPETPHAP